MNPSEESDTKAEHTSPRTILVVGSANADLVVRVPHTPKPGETVIGGDFETLPGGKGANQAVAAARLGANTHFAGCMRTRASPPVVGAPCWAPTLLKLGRAQPNPALSSGDAEHYGPVKAADRGLGTKRCLLILAPHSP